MSLLVQWIRWKVSNCFQKLSFHLRSQTQRNQLDEGHKRLVRVDKRFKRHSHWWTHLWSSLYHSNEAGGTAMASQRKMAVLPKWAGMFFMSVIIGGSGRQTHVGKEEKTRGNSAISKHLPSRRNRLKSAWISPQGWETPGENKIKTFEFIHNNAFAVLLPLIGWVLVTLRWYLQLTVTLTLRWSGGATPLLVMHS